MSQNHTIMELLQAVSASPYNNDRLSVITDLFKNGSDGDALGPPANISQDAK